MITDNTLKTVLDLWKEDKVSLDQVRKLLNLEEGIQWRQPQDLQPAINPWIQPNPWKTDIISTTSNNPIIA